MDLVCFCHLRWHFVYQRPQHLLTRFAKYYRTFFIEEPIFDGSASFVLKVTNPENNIWVVTPHLPHGLSHEEVVHEQKILLKDFFADLSIHDYFFWYYTPMPIEVGNSFHPKMIVYDCMDELSNFKFANPLLREKEKELFSKADIVFTGGHNLYKAKKDHHHNIHPFPSSIDKEHFEGARSSQSDPKDQADIPHPRFGYYGVIDERMNIDMLREVAERKPDWHFVMVGPVIKIDPAVLPKLPNIHYLGSKSYKELPNYLSGWDICIMPFLLNEATEYISPTKTPEYLAGGKPVISTSIKDVVDPYGDNNLVYIADSADEFIKAGEAELNKANKDEWLEEVDKFLASNSWDKTWGRMMDLINLTIKKNTSQLADTKNKAYV